MVYIKYHLAEKDPVGINLCLLFNLSSLHDLLYGFILLTVFLMKDASFPHLLKPPRILCFYLQIIFQFFTPLNIYRVYQ